MFRKRRPVLFTIYSRMKEIERVAKLIQKLNHFIDCLDSRQALIVHQRINQSYYMQKATELSILYEQLNELLEKEAIIKNLLGQIYPDILMHWRKDFIWLSRHERETKCLSGAIKLLR